MDGHGPNRSPDELGSTGPGGHWVYEVAPGALYAPGDPPLPFSYGHSGHGDAMNDPDRVRERSVGPLPPGWYEIGPAHTHPSAGEVTMRLTPLPGTEMYGRAGMLIHGANKTPDPTDDSKGCIVLGRSAREGIAASPIRILWVAPGSSPISVVHVEVDPVPSALAPAPPVPTAG